MAEDSPKPDDLYPEYWQIKRTADALERIADSLDILAKCVSRGVFWVRTIPDRERMT